MMTAESQSKTPEIQYLIRPNRSMDRRQAALTVAAVGMVSLVIAGSLSLVYGAWPILPFAGLEVGLLALVIFKVQASSERQELLVLSDHHLDLTARNGREVRSHRFQRDWVRVVLRNARSRNHPNRLKIGSHGKFVEIGSFLTDDERETLAENLAGRLARAVRIEHF
jgi:uncharacterized membrane protein